jgi:phage FluMu gp28-like protein
MLKGLEKLNLLPYQKAYIKHNGSCIYLKARQVGITQAAAFKHIYKRLGSKRIDLYYSATDELQAINFINHCADVCEWLGVPIKEQASQKLVLFNGSEIHGISSSPKTIRGKSADVILDEFGYHENANELYSAAVPCTTWGTSLEIISTKGNANHKFCKIWEDDSLPGFKRFKTDIYDAIKDGLALEIYKGKHSIIDRPIEEINDDFIKSIRSTCSTREWEIEYECKSAISGESIITSEIYNRNKVDTIIPDHLDPETTYNDISLGIDIGRSRDLTVIWAIEDAGDKYKTIAIKKLDNIPLPRQLEVIEKFVQHKNVIKASIDMQGIGRSISDELVMNYGSIIVPTSIGKPKKKELCEKLRRFAEKGKLTFPNDDKIQDDIQSMRLEYTAIGTEQYIGGTSFSHADYFIACALALQGIEENNDHWLFSIGKSKR